MKRLTTIPATLLLAMMSIPSGWAVSYYLVTDVPATLGGSDHTTAQILRSDSAVYSVALDLGTTDVQFSSLHRRPDGVWLLSNSTPFTLGLTPVTPRDIVAYDGITFSVYFDGVAAGIPEYARIDASFMDAGGSLVLSFDVPVNLGGVEYSPADLVRVSSGVFTLFWDAEASGVPSYANVVGADRDSAGALVLSFDVPTNLAGTEFLPGQLVRWNGGTSFSSYFADGAWPSYAQLRDFAFVPAAGAVPDGSGATMPLAMSAANGNLTLTWDTSCSAVDTDYEVYEGTLGLPFVYNHSEKICSTGGFTKVTFAAPSGSAYYLVVPRNSVSEGSYGRATGGSEIPPGAITCLPQQIAASCP
jgi:hypothetical protein